MILVGSDSRRNCSVGHHPRLIFRGETDRLPSWCSLFTLHGPSPRGMGSTEACHDLNLGGLSLPADQYTVLHMTLNALAYYYPAHVHLCCVK